MFKLIKKLLKISIYFCLIVFVLMFVMLLSDDDTRKAIKQETDAYNPSSKIEKLEKDMNEVKQMNENALKQLKQMGAY
ncbi:hypothetical protein FV935_07840 [Campylobacter jejuni]|nr:hypothetical protein [Campylobacter jejuni]EAL3818957.1 hypothetical protein [Campylobacter jejuni]EDP3942651.1 hypothetical protein [Campylobacter jejuni]HEH6263745.1 hypothetical protein [Campylobacter jejuni]